MPIRDELEARGQVLVGQRAMYSVRPKTPRSQTGDAELVFPVQILEWKIAYSRLRVKIEPVDGWGCWWVEVGTPALKLE